MPLIVMIGQPSSGKSKRSAEIKKYFEDIHKKKAVIVSENDFMSSMKISKNDLCFDPSKEKEIRASMKSETLRLLSSTDVIILDAGNYIKGYRYELYCATKANKTTQCSVECDISEAKAWELNEERDLNEKYTKEAFDSIIARYEAPYYADRWDNPMIVIQLEDELPGDKIYEAIFKRKPPKPNQSTENVPLSNTVLHELDNVTKEIIERILSSKRADPLESCIDISSFKNCQVVDANGELNNVSLAAYRRQFIAYTKLQPVKNTSRDNIAKLFVRFLNSSISS